MPKVTQEPAGGPGQRLLQERADPPAPGVRSFPRCVCAHSPVHQASRDRVPAVPRVRWGRQRGPLRLGGCRVGGAGSVGRGGGLCTTNPGEPRRGPCRPQPGARAWSPAASLCGGWSRHPRGRREGRRQRLGAQKRRRRQRLGSVAPGGRSSPPGRLAPSPQAAGRCGRCAGVWSSGAQVCQWGRGGGGVARPREGLGRSGFRSLGFAAGMGCAAAQLVGGLLPVQDTSPAWDHCRVGASALLGYVSTRGTACVFTGYGRLCV